MAGFQVFTDYHEYYHSYIGNADADFMPATDTPRVALTFANGESGQTLAAVWMSILLGGAWE